jgi:hypothetical protein
VIDGTNTKKNSYVMTEEKNTLYGQPADSWVKKERKKGFFRGRTFCKARVECSTGFGV